MSPVHPRGRHRSPHHRIRVPVAGPRAATALLASVALTITAGLPAFADAGASLDTAEPSPAPAPQEFRVDGGVSPTDARDGYGAVPAGSGSLAYSLLADTFTNYPASPVQWPFERGVPISSGFGPRTPPCPGCSADHDGIDMTPGLGTPVRAIADGVVTSVGGPGGSLGVFAKIDHVVDGRLVRSVYAHMLTGSLTVTVGQRVTVGQQVGQVGTTGQSTGPHLHLGIMLDGTTFTDPFAWLTERVQLP